MDDEVLIEFNFTSRQLDIVDILSTVSCCGTKQGKLDDETSVGSTVWFV